MGATGFLGVMIGYYIGYGKAFYYKLQAQSALCQVEIEQSVKHLRYTALRKC